VHTSAKARLTSVAIRIRDPDRHQNLIICSLAHCQPSVKISCKSVQNFLRKVASRQTNEERQFHFLLGGDKYSRCVGYTFRTSNGYLSTVSRLDHLQLQLDKF